MFRHLQPLRTLFAFVCIAGVSACAKPPGTLTADQPGTTAEFAAAHPSVLAARESEIQAQAEKVAARAGLLPKVALNASVTSYLSDTASPARSNAGSVGIEMKMPILKAFAALNGVRAAEANIRAREHALSAAEADILIQISSAIAGLERANTILSIRNAHRQRLNAFLSEQRKRQTAGDVSATEVEQIRGRIAFADGEIVRAAAAKSESVARLRALVGNTPPGQLAIIDPRQHLPGSEQEAVNLALAGNPGLREAYWLADSAAGDVDLAAANLAPDLDLLVNMDAADVHNIDNSFDATETVSVQLRLSVPLFDGGTRISQVSAKTSQYRESHFKMLALRRTVEADTRAYWYRVDAAIKAQDYAGVRKTRAERALAGVRQARRVGARSTQDELQAYQEWVAARVALAEVGRDLLVNGHRLIAQLGQLGTLYGLVDSQ